MATIPAPLPRLVRPLPLRGLLRIGRAAEIWHKAALSAVAAVGPLLVLLLALGRLDLAGYCCAGAFCALYGHGLPYPARGRTLLGVALAMVGGAAVSLTVSALTGSVTLRVGVAALLAALQKAGCDAARIGPPANVVLTFLTASLIFVPQRLAAVPGHVALAAGGAAVAWAVCMAPALVRPHGPERRATARALETAAALARAGQPADEHARHAATAALDAAWRTLARVPRGGTRNRLEQLLFSAETATATADRPGLLRVGTLAGSHPRPPAGSPVPARTAAGPGAAELARWARQLRQSRRPVPRACPAAVASHPVPEPPRTAAALLRALRPGSPLLPVAVRTALGCAVAGWLSMALGVGRPYWAVVTAGAVFQASTGLTWYRAANRVIGNLTGVLLFAALLPVLGLGPAAMVAVALLCQVLAEATIARSYWLGSTFVTPLALVMTQFAALRPGRELVVERFTDTLVGAAVGLLSCLLGTNRRAGRRTGTALRQVGAAEAEARRLLAAGRPPAELGGARHRLSTALLELREAAETAAGEWWQPPPPHRALRHAERRAHATLAALAHRRAVLALATPVAAAARVRVPAPGGPGAGPVAVRADLAVPLPERA